MEKVKHFLGLEDFSPKILEELLKRSLFLKKKKNIYQKILQKKNLGLVFNKNSTRTRASFEVAIKQLGGTVTYLSKNDTQFSRGESLSDTLRVLGRYFDGLIVRWDDNEQLIKVSKELKVPLVNALTDYSHPCQALADYLTILENKKNPQTLKITYLGDGNNVAHSLAFLAEKLKLHLVVSTPKEYPCQKIVMEKCPQVSFINNPEEAVKDSDVVYTDTWISMGEKGNTKKKLNSLLPFQVNSNLLKRAKSDYIFLHCLPAYRGQEVTSEIIDSQHSRIFDQAENRLHTQKAILEYLFK